MPRIVTTTEFKFLTEMKIIYDHFVGKVRKAGEFNYPRGIASHNNGNILWRTRITTESKFLRGRSECGQFWWERKP